MRHLLFYLMILIPISIFSQKIEKNKKITLEELNFKTCSFEPEASAVILNDYQDYYFDVNANGKNLFLFENRRIRIKILTEDGLKFAKIKIPFHNMHCEELFGENSFQIKAFTYKIDNNGKITSKKLRNKDIIYKDTTNCITIATFQMPDVEVGSVIEYTVIQPTLNLKRPTSRYLQFEIPLLYSQTSFDEPKNFEYIFSSESFDLMDINQQSDYEKILINKTEGYYGNRRVSYNETFNLGGTTHTFVIKNMPSYSIENNFREENESRAKIDFYLKQLRNEYVTIGWKKLTYNLFNTLNEDYNKLTPGQRRMNTYTAAYFPYKLPTWEELNNELNKSERFGMVLVKFWDCKKLVDSLIIGEKNDSVKALKIYNYVRENIKWNGVYEIYADVSDSYLKKLYSRVGSVKPNNIGKLAKSDTTLSSSVINFMMMYLLKKAGFEVAPVLISTSKNGKINELIPDIEQFNHTIAQVIISGKYYYLDAVIPSETIYCYLKQNIKRFGFVVKKEDFGFKDYIHGLTY